VLLLVIWFMYQNAKKQTETLQDANNKNSEMTEKYIDLLKENHTVIAESTMLYKVILDDMKKQKWKSESEN